VEVAGDGISLHVRDEGRGQPVLLVHGFPDSSHLWRHQIDALTSAGMRAIAPDMRGFGESDKPAAVEDYAIAHSVADMVCVLDALDVERCHVVGHDWGAAVAWALAALAPQRVQRLVAMSVGHPAALARPSIEEREKGWYRLFFQFTGVAEQLLARDDWQLMRELLRDAPDVDRYLADLSRPGALTAGLNWYRANLAPERALDPGPPLPPVQAPTLGLWSSGDHYLTEASMRRSAEYVTGDWRYERIEDASHWMQLDATARVDELLLEFLG
jgi:pimeloyl-ACP methyl ester carboxylesterase